MHFLTMRRDINLITITYDNYIQNVGTFNFIRFYFLGHKIMIYHNPQYIVCYCIFKRILM